MKLSILASNTEKNEKVEDRIPKVEKSSSKIMVITLKILPLHC